MDIILNLYLVILDNLPKTVLIHIIIIQIGVSYIYIKITAALLAIVITVMKVYTSFKEIDGNSMKILETFIQINFKP